MMKRLLFLIGFFIAFALHAQQEQKIDPNGYNIFYYENGEVSSEGTMRNGQPDGYWKTYYENGIIKSEGNRKDFKLDSVWTFYSDSGQVAVKITYENGKKNGLRTTYHEEEITKENFADDIKQGYTYIYYPDGALKKEIYFEDGLESGIGREYAKSDGRVIKLIYYKKGYIEDIEVINRIDAAGMKQGKWKYFYDNRQVKLEGEFKNDLKHGYFKEYSKDGSLLSTSKYIDGVLQEDVAELAKLDIKREYYPNGKVKTVASYKDETPEGIRREYSPEGDVVAGYIFKNGTMIGEGIINDEGIKDGPWKEYYPNGAIKSEGTYNNGNRTGQWKFYHPNGQLEQIGSYNKNGKEDGQWTWYYATGDLLREESYFNGMIDGHSVEYDKNGEVISEGDYIEDLRQGTWVFNYGDHKSEGEYFSGMRNGKWRTWYNNGNLSFEGEFIEDNPNGRHTWFWDNGNVKTEGKYIMGLKDGEWIKYNYDGTPFISIFYENGTEKKYDGIKVITPDDEEDL
ncbi:MAG: toxin-antitoxin system YwqK family antitoxin [Bacteroidales bacterium]|nr:toxin-antitoxin system YwqK family antitoxin [Bacteroidales bacterium]